MRSLTSCIAAARRSISSRGVLSTWKARRCALFAPMPGRRCSCSISLVSGSGRLIGQSAASKHAGDFQAAHHPAHLLLHAFVGLALRVVDRRENQVLQHLDIVFRYRFGIDLQREHLLGAVHGHGDHAAAGVALDLHLGHLLLHALLHLLRLLHELLRIHRYISSTSLISAANTSSIVWTPLSAIARSFSSCLRSG